MLFPSESFDLSAILSTCILFPGRQRGQLTHASTIVSPFKFLEQEDALEAATSVSTSTSKNPANAVETGNDKQKIPDWMQFDFSKGKT